MGVSIEGLVAAVAFDAQGLAPVIVQEVADGSVRTLAWANREALEKTAATGLAHFWSRSRQALWRKGETSGNSFHVGEVRLDCDGDAILYRGHTAGPSCHTGKTSCFHRAAAAGGLADDDGPPGVPAAIVARVGEVIAQRRKERPEKSYVVSLLDAGWPKITAKIAEEAGEVIEALPSGDRAHIAHEAADVVFHLLVGLEAAGVPVDDVFVELGRRFGTSGIAEKEGRAKPGKS